jgi:sigma-B regulation protein RsbU (phosphoserine phosphatase)
MEVQLASAFRDQLLDRRQRLYRVRDQTPLNENLQYLLQEVDAALERMEHGTYGICETCHETIETKRLAVDPLIRNCIDHLSAAEQRALERDLDLAFQIQKGLLPKNNLRHNGWHAAYHYEPAGSVSGDYCDIIIPESSTCSLFFHVGDVTGKGVAASILMGHLHAMFRSLSITDSPLGELVAKANRIFCEGTTASHFATLVSGRANRTGEVEVCNAGHPSPLLIRRNGVHPISSTAVPIGVFCASEFPTVHVTMLPGESLVLYTDGLTEATSGLPQQYGDQRLKALLGGLAGSSPQEIIAACIDDLRSFRAGAAKTDDVTILALQRE